MKFVNGGNVKTMHERTYIRYVNKKNKITLRKVLYIPVFERSSMFIDNLSEDKYKTVLYKYNNKKLHFSL